MYSADLAARLGDAADDREHRHAGRRVVAADPQRERPEVRRRPVEDDQEQEHRRAAPTLPVTAAQPMTGGSAPAAPPMTMFWGVLRFSMIV